MSDTQIIDLIDKMGVDLFVIVYRQAERHAALSRAPKPTLREVAAIAEHNGWIK